MATKVLPLRLPAIEKETRASLDWYGRPRDWCFSQLRDAAMATLYAQTLALENGSMLAEARASNVQFNFRGPLLATEGLTVPYQRGPWPAYSQFCRHFLAPLALMRYKPERYSNYEWEATDGVDLGDASRALGLRTWANLDALLHIHLPSRIQALSPGSFFLQSGQGWSNTTMTELLDCLLQAIQKLAPPALQPRHYAQEELQRVMRIDAFLHALRGSPPSELWVDLAAGHPIDPGRRRLVFLSDSQAAERIYRSRNAEAFPIVMDLRDLDSALCGRLFHTAGVVTVCGSLPMLYRGLGMSFRRFGSLLADTARRAVIEWIPPEDADARAAFAGKPPDGYRFDLLWEAMQPNFEIEQIERLPGTDRRLFGLVRR